MIAKPVRKIGKSHRSITGKHVSRKTGTVHRFEFALERDYLILEFDDTVVSYVTQPVTIQDEHEEGYFRYTPDVMVYFKLGLELKPLLCEIKYEAELLDKEEDYASKFNAAHNYAKDNGYRYDIITENWLEQPISRISSYSADSNTPINSAHSNYIILLLQREIFTEIEAMAGNTADRSYIINTIWQLLATKQIGCNMHNKIIMNTLIWNF